MKVCSCEIFNIASKVTAVVAVDIADGWGSISNVYSTHSTFGSHFDCFVTSYLHKKRSKIGNQINWSVIRLTIKFCTRSSLDFCCCRSRFSCYPPDRCIVYIHLAVLRLTPPILHIILRFCLIGVLDFSMVLLS